MATLDSLMDLAVVGVAVGVTTSVFGKLLNQTSKGAKKARGIPKWF
jgi:hypothetical protein